jgi:hypothetical protein
MAKVSGLGWTTLSVDDAAGSPQAIKNDITNLQFSTPYNLQEITGIDKSAMERLSLLADYTGTLNTVFNPSANQMHAVFSGDLRVIRTVALTVSAKNLNAEVLFSDYNLTRAASGEFTAQHPYALADGTTPTWS